MYTCSILCVGLGAVISTVRSVLCCHMLFCTTNHPFAYIYHSNAILSNSETCVPVICAK